MSLYVIELDTNRIKVGYSCNPQTRLATHRATAIAHGLTPGRQWISPPTATLDHERALIKFCADRAGEQHGLEYFTGVPFPTAVRYAAELTGGDPTVEKLAQVRRVLDHVGSYDVAELRRALAVAAAATAPLPRLAFTPEEVADCLSVPLSWVDDLVKRKEVRIRRIGKRVIISCASLEAWLDKAATA